MEVIIGLVGIVAVGFVLYKLLNKKEVEETIKTVETKAKEIKKEVEEVKKEVVEAADIMEETVKKAVKRGRPSAKKAKKAK